MTWESTQVVTGETLELCIHASVVPRLLCYCGLFCVCGSTLLLQGQVEYEKDKLKY